VPSSLLFGSRRHKGFGLKKSTESEKKDEKEVGKKKKKFEKTQKNAQKKVCGKEKKNAFEKNERLNPSIKNI
jgi:hypothetical protein